MRKRKKEKNRVNIGKNCKKIGYVLNTINSHRRDRRSHTRRNRHQAPEMYEAVMASATSLITSAGCGTLCDSCMSDQ